MGARFKNNPPVSNRGYVEQFFCLDMVELLRNRVLVMGEGRVHFPTERFPFTLRSYLQDPPRGWATIEYQGVEQSLVLGCGRKRKSLSFVDRKGKRVKKIYFVRGRFQSRFDARLTHVSKGQSRTSQLVAMRASFNARLKNEDNPANTYERSELEAKLEKIDQEMDLIGEGIVATVEDRNKRTRTRRQLSMERLRASEAAMNRRVSVPTAQILQKYTSRLHFFKQTQSRTKPASASPPSQFSVDTPTRGDFAYLDLTTLARLKIAVAGRLSGRQLGWPIKWVGQRRRKILMLLDLTDPERACVLFVFKNPKRERFQFYWIKTEKGRFGRDEYLFECPHTGDTSGSLKLDGKALVLTNDAYVDAPIASKKKNVNYRLAELRHGELSEEARADKRDNLKGLIAEQIEQMPKLPRMRWRLGIRVNRRQLRRYHVAVRRANEVALQKLHKQFLKSGRF